MPIMTNLPAQAPRMPSPPKSTKDILNLLLATTGLALAARPDTEIELLPGTPTTIAITSNGQIKAAFVLPIKANDVLKAMGTNSVSKPDLDLLALWEEERQAEQVTPEVQLIQAREAAQ